MKIKLRFTVDGSEADEMIVTADDLPPVREIITRAGQAWTVQKHHWELEGKSLIRALTLSQVTKQSPKRKGPIRSTPL